MGLDDGDDRTYDDAVTTLRSLNSYGYSGISNMYGPKFNGNTQTVFNAADAFCQLGVRFLQDRDPLTSSATVPGGAREHQTLRMGAVRGN